MLVGYRLTVSIDHAVCFRAKRKISNIADKLITAISQIVNCIPQTGINNDETITAPADDPARSNAYPVPTGVILPRFERVR